jgi:tetratricopeptide (TPR) repeat protein
VSSDDAGTHSADRKAALTSAAQDALNSGDHVGALRLAEQILVICPSDRQGFMQKAQALAAQGCLADAMVTLDQALNVHSTDAKLLSLARNTAREHSGNASAVQYALRLSAIAPQDLKNELFLAGCDLEAERPEAALQRVDALIQVHPAAARAVTLKSSALISLNRAPDALQLMRDAYASHQNDARFLSFARNIALEHGTVAEAETYALTLSAVAPEDQKNRLFLTGAFLTSGEFAEALEYADALVTDFPSDVSALMLRAKALVALHRVDEALQSLRAALARHSEDPRLLNLLRSIAYQNGRFDEAVDYASRLAQRSTSSNHKAFLVHALMAARRFAEVEQVVGPCKERPERGVLRKEHQHYWHFRKLQETAPAFATAWELALSNGIDSFHPPSSAGDDLNATMIQYWSQGTLPGDVRIVFQNWQALCERERIGTVDLFDRDSAGAWIHENAPEFTTSFSKAFHYAMESDIFRIAYASKRPCIYMDIDSWPLERTADILKFAVRSNETMLYVRSYRAAIVNGFFVSNPDCPFIKRLVEQSLTIDVGALPKDYVELEGAFGPSRYSKVFMELLSEDSGALAEKVEEVPGCSSVSIRGRRTLFAHEAAVASVRPPFPLNYKATEDYWKYYELREQHNLIREQSKG